MDRCMKKIFEILVVAGPKTSRGASANLNVNERIGQAVCGIMEVLRKTRHLLIGKMRRLILVGFIKKAVQARIVERHGECRQCANCCRLIFRCPFLTSDNLCRIYHSRMRFKACVYFPLDERDTLDVRMSSGYSCGYDFTSHVKGPKIGAHKYGLRGIWTT